MLNYLINSLLEENPALRGVQIPQDKDSKRRLFRALCNIREPLPVSEEFLKAQDVELQRQLQEKGIVRLEDIPGGSIRLWQGDITQLQIDAIVNAANSEMLGCFHPLHGCIDNAIHSAAGVQLRLECADLMQALGHPEPTGAAKITKGYNLPAKYVIHTVGPIVQGMEPTDQNKENLASCYRSCLQLAEANGLKSIAFCCISTGEFRFPKTWLQTLQYAKYRLL